MNENTVEVQANNQNLYEILELQATSSFDDIKKSYKTLALQKHPDKGGTPKEFSLLQHAYNTLKDPILRKKYDDSLPINPDITINVKHSWKKINNLEPINVIYTRVVPCCLCKGIGHITLIHNDIIVETCVVCNGHGFLNDRRKSPLPCFNCVGTGKVTIENQSVVAHSHVLCKKCNGKKTLSDENHVCIPIHDYIENEKKGLFCLKGFGNYILNPHGKCTSTDCNVDIVGNLFINVMENENESNTNHVNSINLDIVRYRYDIHVNKYITFADCMFGGNLSFTNPLTDQTCFVKIDPLINHDGLFESNKLRILLTNEGLTQSNGLRGNIVIQLLVIFPDFDPKNKENLSKSYGGITLT